MTDTEVRARVKTYFRNPDNYIKELVEVPHALVAWDRGYLAKKRIDPVRHAELYFAGLPYEALDVGNAEQGAALYLPGCTRDAPAAVYPVVSMLDPAAISQLEELAGNPSGDNEEACMDTTVPSDERPVMGQDHVIIVTDFPGMDTGRGRSIMKTIRDVQADYPDCTIHIHGLYSWRALFGFGFKSVDIEVRQLAQKGKVILPVGRELKYEATMLLPQWITLLGMKVSDLSIPRNRCIYNARSALWAADNYSESVYRRFRRDPNLKPEDVDTDSSDASFVPATTRSPMTGTLPVLPTDKVHCDTCSLTEQCKVYREGSVCTLGRDNKSLVQMFQTRDSAVVMEGLSAILAKQAERTERAMEDEIEFGETSPEVTSMLNSLFSNGVKYAKLIDPALRAGPKVAVQVNGAGAVTVGSERGITAQQAMKEVFSALEGQGFHRSEITPAMVKNMLTAMYGSPLPAVPAIPGVIEGSVG